jgi:hypothetical protein
MEVNSRQEIAAWFPSTTHGYDSVNCIVLAQTIKDPDILGSWQKSFDHFVQSGQVWALLIGIAIGYLFRSLTSYG